jgi:hypothetical protein
MSVNQAERTISSFIETASKSVAVVPSPMNDAAQQALCNHREEPEGSL